MVSNDNALLPMSHHCLIKQFPSGRRNFSKGGLSYADGFLTTSLTAYVFSLCPLNRPLALHGIPPAIEWD